MEVMVETKGKIPNLWGDCLVFFRKMTLSTEIVVTRDNPRFHRETICLEGKPEWFTTLWDDLSTPLRDSKCTGFLDILSANAQGNHCVHMVFRSQNKNGQHLISEA